MNLWGVLALMTTLGMYTDRILTGKIIMEQSSYVTTMFYYAIIVLVNRLQIINMGICIIIYIYIYTYIYIYHYILMDFEKSYSYLPCMRCVSYIYYM